MEELLKELGYDSKDDFHKLVASVDISNEEKLKLFLDWKNSDGSKKGLLKLKSTNKN